MRTRILLVVLIAVLCGCRSVREIQVTAIEGINVANISMEGIDAGLKLRLKNPNSFGFNIYRSEFDVIYSGVKLGKARLNKKVRIKGNSEQTYTFDLKGDWKGVNLMEVGKLLTGLGFKNTIEVQGDLRAGNFLIKKRIPVKVSEKLKLR